METRNWIVVASKDHAHHGVKGSFIQANHGKRGALDRMRPGDRLAVYSPREVYGEPGRLQAFTALGTICDGAVWQADEGPDFKPFRRKVSFEPVKDAPLLSLLARLDFIKNKKAYGVVFRFGVVRIPEADFRLIEAAMRAKS